MDVGCYDSILGSLPERTFLTLYGGWIFLDIIVSGVDEDGRTPTMSMNHIEQREQKCDHNHYH